MKGALTILAMLALALQGGAPARAEGGRINPNYVPASYYGENDLRDYYQASQIMRRLSESTVAIFSPRALVRAEDGGYRLGSRTLQGRFNLREGEAFNDQPAEAYCSGVLVGADLVLTAGHCFRPHPKGGPCGEVRFLFGYALNRAGEAPREFPAENVYTCSSVLVQKVREEKDGRGHNFVCRNGSCTESPLNGNGADFALVRLDRPVAGRHPLAISRRAIAPGASVGAIGYPSGMPVKIQEQGAAVRTVNRNGFFTANLDTFGGNSGSPVFNLQTFKIEGVLIRGGVDYVYTVPGSTATVEDPSRPYNYSPGQANYYPQDGGRGEDVTLITEVEALIPATEMERTMDEAARLRLQQGETRPAVRPAIYTPGEGGLQVQPAIYTAPEVSEPEPVWI